MAKRLSIPRTDGEAERFLWHAIEHLSRNGMRWLGDLEARVLMRRLICLLNDHTKMDGKRRNEMDRYTRKDAQAQFERLIEAIGGRVAQRFDDHGAYHLDWNATYGGGVIERISANSSGVSQPFGANRKNAREFCEAVHFAMRVLEEAKVSA